MTPARHPACYRVEPVAHWEGALFKLPFLRCSTTALGRHHPPPRDVISSTQKRSKIFDVEAKLPPIRKDRNHEEEAMVFKHSALFALAVASVLAGFSGAALADDKKADA